MSRSNRNGRIQFLWGLTVLLVLALLVVAESWAKPPKAGDKVDPQAIEDVDETEKRVTEENKRDWDKHPGFFHYGFAVEMNYLTAGATFTGAAQGANGMGLGGLVFLDYDFTRKWLVGFRLSAGFKRLFLASDETIPSAINAFPITILVQKLKRVSKIATFRYGIGTSLEIIDANGEIQTDNAIVVSADFDFPFIMTGVRYYLYRFHSNESFHGVEAILGFRF